MRKQKYKLKLTKLSKDMEIMYRYHKNNIEKIFTNLLVDKVVTYAREYAILTNKLLDENIEKQENKKEYIDKVISNSSRILENGFGIAYKINPTYVVKFMSRIRRALHKLCDKGNSIYIIPKIRPISPEDSTGMIIVFKPKWAESNEELYYREIYSKYLKEESA